MPTEHFEVTGRVQGVGFRWFVREQARALDLAGWVRNLPSGAVELVAAGPPGALDKLERALREGPPGARVERVTRRPSEGIEAQLAVPFAIAR
ncbi:MAG TPA: acylphosphatase [Gemmatimonadaceae bacterium]|nr:acylphosphatase [Gemmatimonadaceae bacterium]